MTLRSPFHFVRNGENVEFDKGVKELQFNDRVESLQNHVTSSVFAFAHQISGLQ